MPAPILRPLRTACLMVALTLLCHGPVLAGSIHQSPATKADCAYFSKVFHSRMELYCVDLLFRSCSKEVNGSVLQRDGKTGHLEYDADKNLYYDPHVGLNASTDSNKQGATQKMLQYCKPVDTPRYRLKTVLSLNGTVIGWILETVNEYCQIPVYKRVQSVDCYFSHCRLTIPAQTEGMLISPYAEFAEDIRKAMQPVTDLDSLDPHPKRLCTDLE